MAARAHFIPSIRSLIANIEIQHLGVKKCLQTLVGDTSNTICPGNYLTPLKPKDADYPFPWSTVSSDVTHDSGRTLSGTAVASGKRNLETEKRTQPAGKKPMSRHVVDYFDQYPQLRDLQTQMEKLYPGQIDFQLPRLHALSGTVVRHCSNLIEQLLASQSPMTFKIGYTHNALWRWGNSLYGYVKSKDRFSNMIVAYVSEEPFSASMLEAALIDKYQSILAEHGRGNIYVVTIAI